MSGAYYNEHDPKAAAWLRELIRSGHIAPGDVDERSIEDIAPYEIQRYTQCHFFAGIGVWSYALRLAEWPDTRRVWTGSCPCQPFSQAGKGAGTSDERHLWPAWQHLIRERSPSVIFGEQVASKAADSWADLVQDDLEALGYAFGAIPFPAASVGAPHIRDRLYWLAVSESYGRREERAIVGRVAQGDRAQGVPTGSGSSSSNSRLADDDAGREQHAQRHGEQARGLEAGEPGCDAGGRGNVRGMADSNSTGLEVVGVEQARGQRSAAERGGETCLWNECEWVWCRDDKWRPVEPGTFPLAHGAPERVGRLRGYGNAIVAQAAKVFIEASGLV